MHNSRLLRVVRRGGGQNIVGQFILVLHIHLVRLDLIKYAYSLYVKMGLDCGIPALHAYKCTVVMY